MFWYLLSRIFIFAEMNLLYCFCRLFLKDKKSKRQAVLRQCMWAAAILLFMELYEQVTWIIWQTRLPISAFIVMPLCVVGGLFLFQCRPVYLCSITALYYAVLYAFQFLGRAILFTFIDRKMEDGVLLHFAWAYHLQWFSALCFIAAIYFWIKKKKPQENAAENKFGLLFCLICTLFLFSVCCLLMLLEQSLPNIRWLITALGLLLIFFVAILFALLYRYHQLRTREMEYELISLNNTLLEKNMNEVNAVYESNARRYHDMKNHLILLRGAAQQNDWQAVHAYLEELSGDLPQSPFLVHTEEKMLNRMINSKYNQAILNKIEFSAEVHYPKDAGIKATDICSVLGNLLDNAIEACKKAESTQPKIILKILSKNDFLILKISNTVLQNPLLENKTLQTTKTDYGHGIGIQSVRATILKYNGAIDFYFEEGLFHAIVTLCFTPLKTPSAGGER